MGTKKTREPTDVTTSQAIQIAFTRHLKKVVVIMISSVGFNVGFYTVCVFGK